MYIRRDAMYQIKLRTINILNCGACAHHFATPKSHSSMSICPLLESLLIFILFLLILASSTIADKVILIK